MSGGIVSEKDFLKGVLVAIDRMIWKVSEMREAEDSEQLKQLYGWLLDYVSRVTDVYMDLEIADANSVLEVMLR